MSEIITPVFRRRMRKLSGPEMKTYFFQSIFGGPIKIGRSSDVRSRLETISSHNPTRISCVLLIDADEEHEWHNQWSHIRIHREWFANT